jgi:alpha-glucosidase
MTSQSIARHITLVLTSVAFGGALGCSSDAGDPTLPPNNSSGGASGTAGSATLAGSSGTLGTGGATLGGSSGTATGGATLGGSSGTASGGAQTGGASSGGNIGSGGASMGGASAGGALSGGASSAGNAGKSGSSSTGGTGGTGGAAAGSGGKSSGAGGGTATGGRGGAAGSAGNGGSSAGSSGVAGSSGTAGSGGSAGGSTGMWCQSVGTVPSDVRTSWKINTFYQKYTNANGIPILSSSAPSDRSLILACELVVEMVSKRDDVRLALIRNKTFFAMLGTNEKTNQIPEYAYLGEAINNRARGLGGNPGLCSEEGILCGPTDRWKGESICVHEFAHTISIYGLYHADTTFQNRLKAAYNAAKSAGRFANTYAMENEQEYWGEGVQDWYYTNLESATPNGVHGPIDKREELRDYDRALYDLVGELLPTDVKWEDCYRDG